MKAIGLASYSSRSLPCGMLVGRRIEEHAPLEQRAVKVGDQRADVARGVALAQLAAAQPGEVVLIGGRGAVEVGLVHRVVLALRRHADVRVAEHVGADGRIEREAVHAVAGAVDQHRRGAVDDVAGGDLLGCPAAGPRRP